SASGCGFWASGNSSLLLLIQQRMISRAQENGCRGNTMRLITWTASLLLPAGALMAAAAHDRLDEASQVFSEIMAAPDKGIPQDLLDKSQCVVIIPGLKKAALGVGGQYGRGFVTCRRHGGTGWGAPASVRMEGGSVGLQLGASSTDVVMLVMNQRGMDR